MEKDRHYRRKATRRSPAPSQVIAIINIAAHAEQTIENAIPAFATKV
jgi:hypothetical protein